MDREASLSRLRSARVGRIATVTSKSRPHVVPFVFALVEEDSGLRAYWAVDRKPKRSNRLRRLRNLEHNPAVEFEVDGYDEDWDRLWWVRAAGTGRIVDSDDERARAIAALEAKYPQYANAPPEGPVVAIEIDAITGWEASFAPDDP